MMAKARRAAGKQRVIFWFNVRDSYGTWSDDREDQGVHHSTDR